MCGRSSGELLGARLTVGQRGQQRREPLALAAALDRRDPAQERLPALGQEPVHLRVRPPGQLADLAVGVALRLQHEGADLVRLEAAERLGALAQLLEPLGLVMGNRRRRRPVAEVPVIGDGRMPITLAAQGEGFVLHHCLQPRDQLFLARGGRLREQDLEPALVGVLGVLGRGRVAARGGEDLGAVAAREAEGRLVDLAPRGPRPWLQHLHDAQPGWCYSSPPAGTANCARCELFLYERIGCQPRDSNSGTNSAPTNSRSSGRSMRA